MIVLAAHLFVLLCKKNKTQTPTEATSSLLTVPKLIAFVILTFPKGLPESSDIGMAASS